MVDVAEIKSEENYKSLIDENVISVLEKATNKVQLVLEKYSGIKFYFNNDLLNSLRNGIILCRFLKIVCPNHAPIYEVTNNKSTNKKNLKMFLEAVKSITKETSYIFSLKDFSEPKVDKNDYENYISWKLQKFINILNGLVRLIQYFEDHNAIQLTYTEDPVTNYIIPHVNIDDPIILIPSPFQNNSPVSSPDTRTESQVQFGEIKNGDNSIKELVEHQASKVDESTFANMKVENNKRSPSIKLAASSQLNSNQNTSIQNRIIQTKHFNKPPSSAITNVTENTSSMIISYCSFSLSNSKKARISKQHNNIRKHKSLSVLSNNRNTSSIVSTNANNQFCCSLNNGINLPYHSNHHYHHHYPSKTCINPHIMQRNTAPPCCHHHVNGATSGNNTYTWNQITLSTTNIIQRHDSTNLQHNNTSSRNAQNAILPPISSNNTTPSNINSTFLHNNKCTVKPFGYNAQNQNITTTQIKNYPSNQGIDQSNVYIDYDDDDDDDDDGEDCDKTISAMDNIIEIEYVNSSQSDAFTDNCNSSAAKDFGASLEDADSWIYSESVETLKNDSIKELELNDEKENKLILSRSELVTRKRSSEESSSKSNKKCSSSPFKVSPIPVPNLMKTLSKKNIDIKIGPTENYVISNGIIRSIIKIQIVRRNSFCNKTN